MSKTIDVYTGRITPYQSQFPNFVATVSGTLQPVVDVAATIESLPAAFDLDEAIGAQLDVVGMWIGRSRDVPLPIPGTDFTWSDPNRGWGRGIWKGPYSQAYGITKLDDVIYRRLLYAKILANSWDGTVGGAQAILDTFFVDPATYVFIVDAADDISPPNGFAWGIPGRGWGQSSWLSDQNPNLLVNCQMTIVVAGTIPAPVYLGLLAQNALTIKPGGVTVKYLVTSVSGSPVFGFGITNQYIAGWGEGAWGVTPEYLLENT